MMACALLMNWQMKLKNHLQFKAVVFAGTVGLLSAALTGRAQQTNTTSHLPEVLVSTNLPALEEAAPVGP